MSIDIGGGGTTALGTFIARNRDIVLDHSTVNEAIIGGFLDDGTHYAFPFRGSVPEPSSIALALLGFAGVLWRPRR